MKRILLTSIALCLYFACLDTITYAAAEPPRTKKTTTDRFGDPLPPGAESRLGSNRWRVSELVVRLAFGHSDKEVLASTRSRVIVFDRKTGKELRRFPVSYTHNSRATTFSLHGKWFAVAERRFIRVYDTATGKQTKTIKVADLDYDDGCSIAFSPDSKLLALAAKQNVVLIEWSTGKLLDKFDIGKNAIIALEFSPDGKILAVAPYRGGAQLWCTTTGKLLRKLNSPQFAFLGRFDFGFSPDGRLFATTNQDGVHVVEINSGKLVARLNYRFELQGMRFVGNSKIVAGGQGSGLWLWDLKQQKRIYSLSDWDHHMVIALSHDHKVLAVGDSAGGHRINLRDLATGNRLNLPYAHDRRIGSVRFRPDNKTLVTRGDRKAIFWSAENGEKLRQVKEHMRGGLRSSDGKLAASCTMKRIWLYNLQNGKTIKEITYKGKSLIRFGAFTIDCKHLITAHNSNSIRQPSDFDVPSIRVGENGLHIWDVASGKEARRMTTALHRFYTGLVLTPDGTRAVLGSTGGYIVYQKEGFGYAIGHRTDEGGEIYVWDLRLGKEVLILKGHKGASQVVAVSPDSRWVASGGYDDTIRVWELVTGQPIFTFKSKASHRSPIAFSPDSRFLVAGENNSSSNIRVWDLANGKEVHHFQEKMLEVWNLAFSPDGFRLASTMDNGTVLLWDMKPAYKSIERKPRKIQANDYPKLWSGLRSLDAVTSHRNIWRLVEGGDDAVIFLRQKLRPIKADLPP